MLFDLIISLLAFYSEITNVNKDLTQRYPLQICNSENGKQQCNIVGMLNTLNIWAIL